MAQKTKKSSQVQLIILIATVLLFVLLAISQTIPLSYGSTEQYIYQAGLQLTRSQGFAKNALLLQHGTTDQKTQALSDMQVVLPLFVNEQNVLLRNSQQDIQTVLQEARPNYLAVVSAVMAIINHTQLPVDPKQVTIIEENSPAYTITMNQYLLILQNQANDWNMRLVLFQEIITVFIGVNFITLQMLHKHHLISQSLQGKEK